MVGVKRCTATQRAAVRAFQKGRISIQAARILNTSNGIVPHTIYWLPAHVGSVKDVALNPNQSAHAAARALTDRAALEMGDDHIADDDTGHKDTPTTHNEIAKYYYMVRRVLPPPHSKINIAQVVSLRLLQTHSYPSLA